MKSSRLRIAAFAPLALIAIGLVVRPILYARFHDGPFAASDLGLAIAAGIIFDALVGILAATPLTLAIATLQLKILEKTWARAVLFTVIGASASFAAFIEWFFFEEFNSRFNNIAIDYIRSPKEVLGNIQESYHVVTFLGAALACGALVAWVGVRATRGAVLPEPTWRLRTRRALWALAVSSAAAVALEIMPAEVSHDRVVSEVAQNGIDRLVHAARTGQLDYDVYYRTLPPELAKRRAAGVLAAPWLTGQPAPPSGGEAPRPWDVVVILEESFGSEFIGVSRGGTALKQGSDFTERIVPGARHEVFNETDKDETLGQVAAFVERVTAV